MPIIKSGDGFIEVRVGDVIKTEQIGKQGYVLTFTATQAHIDLMDEPDFALVCKLVKRPFMVGDEVHISIGADFFCYREVTIDKESLAVFDRFGFFIRHANPLWRGEWYE